jgi:hypothetical protein
MMTNEQTWGPWRLTLRVIDEPAEVFRRLAARPTAWVPIVTMVIVVALTSFAMPSEPIAEATRTQMEAVQRRAPDQITDEAIEERVELATSARGRAISLASQIVIYLIGFAAVAAVLMLVFGAVGSEPLGYKDEFAIVTHAFVPQLLGFILIVLLTRFAGVQQLSLSLGFLFDSESAPFMHNVGNQFTLFGAWNMVLLALGNQIRTGAKTLGGPLAIVGGLWVLLNVVLAAMVTFLAGLGG